MNKFIEETRKQTYVLIYSPYLPEFLRKNSVFGFS